jgi:membrane-bound lytic murein transglycosylase A
MTGRTGARHAGRFGRVAALALAGMLALGGISRSENQDDEAEGIPVPAGPMRIADTRLEPITWADIDGWLSDDHAGSFATFLASCRTVVAGAKASPHDPRPVFAALAAVCGRALAAMPLEADAARQFFEDNFRPVRIARIESETGLLTGYYEPVVQGSRFPTGDFKVPLYRRPPDLVHMGSKRRMTSQPNKGRVVRRINWRKFVPYYDRAEIEDGVLDGRHLEICYVKSWTDVLFMQIQGSARVRLEDGVTVRVNYDSHNGQPGTSVGRTLIDRNLISREDMSMDRIRAWMEANPQEANEVRRLNKAFVFFRVVGLSEFDEAAGAQGVPLTPVRSIAVDRAIHVYGTPFFIEADLPIASDAPMTRFRRLMIAQDTGSAIVGPARADIFFGAGDEAGRVAGRIKQQGRFTMLLPRELDLVEAGKAMPLPPGRPPEAIEKTAETASPPRAGPVPLPPERPLEAAEPLPGPVPLPQPKPK